MTVAGGAQVETPGAWPSVRLGLPVPPYATWGRRVIASLLDGALAFWNRPPLGAATHRALLSFARTALGDAGSTSWKRKEYAVMTQNALRHLIAVSPELQAA